MATTGDSIGPWTLHEKLGVGRNATVWRASHEDGEVVALKVIKTTKAQHEPYRRFVQEGQFLQKLGDFPGVLPLLDAHLPEHPKSTDRAWLAMPVATPIAHVLADAPLDTIVAALARLRRRWPSLRSGVWATATSSRATSTSWTDGG